MPFAGHIPSREGTASSQMRKIELSEIVRDALEVLGDDQRMAVLLNKFEDMSYAEIGEVMSRSPAAIKSLLARARNELRERLEPYLAAGDGGPIEGPCRPPANNRCCAEDEPDASAFQLNASNSCPGLGELRPGRG